MTILRATLLSILLALLLSQALFAQPYNATSIYCGRHTYLNGLNDSGAIALRAVISPTQAYLWTSTTHCQDLGTLGGRYSEALAINNLEQVVGDASPSGNSAAHAFLWTQSGGMQDLGVVGFAHAINDNTQVAGYYYPGNSPHAFLWTQAGGLQDLGTLGGSYSYAFGMNSAGHIVGFSTLADGTSHAFLWTAEGGMQDLGIQGVASAINDSDQVVGSYFNPQANHNHAFLWTAANGLKDLGTLGGDSAAGAINNAGDIVGYSFQTGHRKFTAVIWKNGGPIQKLGDLVVGKRGFGNSYGSGINSSGQIIVSPGGTLLTPTTMKPSSKKIASAGRR